ncbi:MAG: hypothetical protein ACI8PZ_003430 [Myxococcota bacterium]|jgi:hypothetical protein
MRILMAALIGCSGAKTEVDRVDTASTVPLTSGTGGSSTITGDCGGPGLILNELAPKGSELADDAAELDDWIEIINPEDVAVDLEGWGITDALGEDLPWRFIAGAVLEAGEYGLVWADEQPEQGPLHVGLKLSADGETVWLLDPMDCVVGRVSFPELEEGTWGRVPDRVGEFAVLDTPTPGAPNTDGTATTPCAGAIRVNEVMPDNTETITDEADEAEDWIELYNVGRTAVSLDGWQLGDVLPGATEPLWSLPDGLTLEPGGYLVIWADEEPEQGPLHADFKLAADGEQVIVVDPDGCLTDQVVFPALGADQAWGRTPDGGLDFAIVEPTPGGPNPG